MFTGNLKLIRHSSKEYRLIEDFRYQNNEIIVIAKEGLVLDGRVA